MNKRIKELAKQSGAFFIPYSKDYFGEEYPPKISTRDMDFEKFANSLVQACANFVRDNYDHESAETIAWTMEIEFGLHGDYA